MLLNTTNANAHLVTVTREYINDSKSDRTKRAYQYQWGCFTTWCQTQGAVSLPASPDTVAMYLASMALSGKKVATIKQAVAALGKAHELAGHESPTRSAVVRETLQGIGNRHGAPQDQKAPVLVEHLKAMVRACPDTLIGKRDKALLLVGFAGAFRRSELVALDVQDVQLSQRGTRVLVRRSKTDQRGQGRWISIPFAKDPETCPVRSLETWLQAADAGPGPLFRGVNRHGQVRDRLDSKDVARVVKKYAEVAGLDPATVAGHSLRAGLITSAVQAGVPTHKVQQQSGHASVQMLSRYIRDAESFKNNPASIL